MANPQTTRGFIIARMPYGNTSLIIRCLCKQAGRLTLMAKGAARPKSPFAGALDLFYLADFHYQPSRTGEMHTLRETVTESGTPVPEEYELFGKALAYLCLVDITWRAVERFERRILIHAGIAHADRDLPQAFRALHHKVPALRKDLLKLLAESEA